MKVSKEKAAENRQRILGGAARMFREQGLSGVGVDALTEGAGLTYGSLYSHFGSKDALMAEAVTHAFVAFADKTSGIKNAADFVEHYLSAEHRDSPGDGCAVAGDEKAWGMLATLMGAMVLARAVNDPALSDRILHATRKRLSDDE